MNDETAWWVAKADELLNEIGRLAETMRSGTADEKKAALDGTWVRVQSSLVAAKLDRMTRLLPAWFTERMANDVWAFGLLLTTGRILHIETIHDVSQAADGSLWLDVRLGKQNAVDADHPQKVGWPPLAHSPTDRDTCSVAVSHIVCAVELADT